MPTPVVRSGTKTPILRSPTPGPLIVNREHWLQNCGELIAPHIEVISAQTIPDFFISVSMPTRKGLSLKKRTIGQCIPLTKQGKKSHLFIHPMLVSLDDVAGTVAHELIHILTLGHGRPFSTIARPLGLQKPWTATSTTPAFYALEDRRGRSLKSLLEKLGPYPHEALDISGRTAVKTYLVKLQCKCGFVARATKKWIDDVGMPTCACGAKWRAVEPKRRVARKKAR
jgi:hypothetical protein